jgi:hypothetical protein
VRFDEKYYGINFLNASSGLLQDDLFDVVSDFGSLLLFFISSTGKWNFVPILTRSSTFEPISQSISISIGLSSITTKIVLTSYRPSAVNNSSPLSCLSRWVANTIEYIGLDVGDIYLGHQTQS